ncbi:MAG: hypothetical protein PHY34_02710 [Patescibacteria group bacterium]|nr:hypothetical protein [Patescibacteria group bacterium]MDD5715447.1 hypothetical protein [Patescibacteria group bacterium]
MDHRELLHWLREARAQGLSDMDIQRHLHDAGLSHRQINILLVNGYVPIGESESMLDTVEVERALTLPQARIIFRESSKIFKQRAGTFMAISFFFAIPFVLMLTICALVLSSLFSTSGDTTGYSTLDLTDGTLIVLLGLAVGTGIIGSFIVAWFQSAITMVITNPGGAQTHGTIIKKSWRHIRSVWLTVLLATAVAIGGTVLAVIPGIVFAVEYAFVIFIAITDGVGGSKALMASRHYSRRAILPLMSRFGILLVPLVALVSLLGCGTASLSSHISTASSFTHSLLTLLFSCGIIGLAGIFLLPVISCYAFILFQFLKKQQAARPISPIAKHDAKMPTTAIVGWALMPVVFMLIIGIGTHKLDLVQAKNRNTERLADIDTLHNALMLYHEDNGSFPATIDDLAVGYIARYPRDPETNQPYQYELNTDGGFRLCATLEREEQNNATRYCRD